MNENTSATETKMINNHMSVAVGSNGAPSPATKEASAGNAAARNKTKNVKNAAFMVSTTYQIRGQ